MPGDQLNLDTMSGGGTDNFTPTRRNWQVGQDSGAFPPTRQAPFSRSGSISFLANPDASRGTHYPWRSFAERGLTEPFSIISSPADSHSPVQIPVLVNPMARDIRPNHSQSIQRSPSGLTNQQNILLTQGNVSRLSRDEQNTAVKKLKKEVYNPTLKKLTKGLSLYYRDQARNVHNEMEKQKENDAARCAVCLEDFEPKETVMLTPCNHMFHEDCIVPWVKNHPQCPVCRFLLGEKRRESASDNNIGIVNAPGDNLLAVELMSLIRAIEDAFIRENAAR